MGADALATDAVISLTSDGAPLACGGSVAAGAVLAAEIAGVTSNLLIEVSGATFASGSSCGGAHASESKADA